MFITYWEINPDFDPAELAEIAQELISKKIYPAEGVTSHAFYISTSDYWGIGIDEADSEAALKQLSRGMLICGELLNQVLLNP